MSESSGMLTKGIRVLLLICVVLASTATSSFATVITYDYSAEITLVEKIATTELLGAVQFGDVFHGTITVDTSIPNTSVSPDDGNYAATSLPSILSVTIGPYVVNPVITVPPTTFPTSDFGVVVRENGTGFFGAEELTFLNLSPFLSNGLNVEDFEVRLDSNDLSFLNGTGLPMAIDFGLVTGSKFDFIGTEPEHGGAFNFEGSIISFGVASSGVPEPGTIILLGSGLAALVACRRWIAWGGRELPRTQPPW
jgi:hypothetical protein